jgi:hypothetical protein
MVKKEADLANPCWGKIKLQFPTGIGVRELQNSMEKKPMLSAGPRTRHQLAGSIALARFKSIWVFIGLVWFNLAKSPVHTGFTGSIKIMWVIWIFNVIGSLTRKSSRFKTNPTGPIEI